MGKGNDMIDVDQFENTAAWLEYCDGMSRFQAESEAARRQGVLRKEALQNVKDDQRNSQGQRHIGSAHKRNNSNDMPAMQPHPAQQKRPMPERDVQG